MNQRVGVIAGNQREWGWFIQDRAHLAKDISIQYNLGRAEIDGVTYVYLSHPDKMRGLAFDDFVYVGTWDLKSPRELDLLSAYIKANNARKNALRKK